MTIRLCTEPGCTSAHLAKGYCRKHYRAHGLDASYGRAYSMTAECKACGKSFSKTTSNKQRMTSCSADCRVELIRQAGRARRETWPASNVYVRNCSWCDSLFVTPVSSKKRCSRYCAKCSAARHRDASNMQKHVRRARIRDTATETIRVRDIYKRDDYMCGICHEGVDMALTSPNPSSHSLDHIIPLARGGTHTYGNVQLAHLRCNYLKSDSMLHTLPPDGDPGVGEGNLHNFRAKARQGSAQ